MLKIIGYTENRIEKIEFDDYVPFNIQFNDSSFINLWTVVQENTLFEVAVNNSSGAVEYITLVSIKKENIELTNENFSTGYCEVKNGVPICDCTKWSKAHFNEWNVREERKLKLVVGDNFIRLFISNSYAKKYYKKIRAYIGVNELNELVEVAINDISHDEMGILKSCLRLNEK